MHNHENQQQATAHKQQKPRRGSLEISRVLINRCNTTKNNQAVK